MKIALLSDVSAEVLAGMLREDFDVWTPPGFGAWAETALAPPRELEEFAPDAIFLAIDDPGAAAKRLDPAVAADALRKRFPGSAVRAIDVRAVERGCTAPFRDARMAALAAMPWSLAGLRALRAEIAMHAEDLRGELKKAIAVDFDGTLWDGTVGEDGPEGISPRADFQRALLEMSKRGTLLAGITKNDPRDAARVWNAPGMILKEEDFAAIRAGWEPKPQSLEEIARTLNISPGAFVFIDDNPGERAEMRASRTGAAVPDFPSNPGELAGFAQALERVFFPRGAYTAEDAAKTAMYRAEAKRREAEAALGADGYFKRLALKVSVRAARDEDCARLAQLSAKSNQMNATGTRRTEEEIREYAHAEDRAVFAVSARDRFGDYGTIAFINAKISGETAEIEDFTMSCRAMNRRIEHAAALSAETRLAARGVRTLRATWRATGKNAPAEKLFDSLGYTLESEGADFKKYVLALPRRGAAPEHHAEIEEDG